MIEKAKTTQLWRPTGARRKNGVSPKEYIVPRYDGGGSRGVRDPHARGLAHVVHLAHEVAECMISFRRDVWGASEHDRELISIIRTVRVFDFFSPEAP